MLRWVARTSGTRHADSRRESPCRCSPAECRGDVAWRWRWRRSGRQRGREAAGTESARVSRSRAGGIAALPPQRLERGGCHCLHGAVRRTLAGVAGAGRPASGHVRPGCVHRVAVSIPGIRAACRWGTDLHAARVSAGHGPPRRWAHVRAAAWRTGTAGAHHAGECRRLLGRRERQAAGRCLHSAQCRHRRSPTGGRS